MVSKVRALRRSLPAGRPLPERAWSARHRGLQVVLWLHLIGLLLVGATAGSLEPAVLLAVPLAVAGLTASAPWLRRAWREAAMTVGLLATSAVLVTSTGGRTEAHAHVFAVLALIALYQRWIPYLLAIGFTASAYLVLTAIDPTAVFSAPEAMERPFVWAGLHVVAVAAASGIYVTSWRLAETERERSDRVLDATAEGIFGVDVDGMITFANRATATMLGVHVDDLLGQPHPGALAHGTPDGRARAPPDCRVCQAVATAEGIHVADHTFGRGDGHRFAVEISANPIMRGGRREGTVVTFTDLTERADLTRRALHDPLTGLPNRMLFVDHLDQALRRLSRNATLAAVLFVDLDRFKAVNDSLGHAAGDTLLRQVALRLNGIMRAHDTVARFGGDEFVVLCEDLTDDRQAVTIADRIVAALGAPYLVEGTEVDVSASVGMAIARRDRRGVPTREHLLRDADAAMYRAKDAGRNTYEVHDPELRERAVEQQALQLDLKLAIQRDTIEVHYQPQVSTENGEIVGVEAQPRWHHPVRGDITPAMLVAVAEDAGLIGDLGRLVLRRACADTQVWRDARPCWRDLRVAVTVSARQLGLVRLPGDIDQVLSETGVAPGHLCIQVHESTVLDDPSMAVEVVTELKDLGVAVAVTEVGSSGTPLASLAQIGPDRLTIGAGHVARLPHDPRSSAVARAVVGLGRGLGVRIAADGVTTTGQLTTLRALGCDVVQGDLMAPALPTRSVEGVLIDGVG